MDYGSDPCPSPRGHAQHLRRVLLDALQQVRRKVEFERINVVRAEEEQLEAKQRRLGHRESEETFEAIKRASAGVKFVSQLHRRRVIAPHHRVVPLLRRI